MSASPVDPDSLPTEVKDGLVASVLGGLAMIARLLLSAEPVTLPWVFRRVAAASITALFCGMLAKEYIASVPLQFCAVGAAGYAAPECLDYLLKFLKQRAEKELGKGAPKGEKGNAKGKHKRRRA